MSPTLFLATANAGKARELRQLLPSTTIQTLQEVPLTMPEETGTTFEANAVLKAEFAAAELGVPVLADDSGLVVDALGGAPGVRSARYVEGTDADRYQKLLSELAGEHLRTARFVCAMALARPGQPTVVTEGTCEGVIGLEARGEQGFGYDPVFLPRDAAPGADGRTRTMGELDAKEKNVLSHRRQALDAMHMYLRELW